MILLGSFRRRWWRGRYQYCSTLVVALAAVVTQRKSVIETMRATRLAQGEHVIAEDFEDPVSRHRLHGKRRGHFAYSLNLSCLAFLPRKNPHTPTRTRVGVHVYDCT